MAVDKTIRRVSFKECTGCYGCVNVCSHDAISMYEDERGFMHPQINPNKCTNCGACYSKCPIASPHPLLYFETKAYSVAAPNDICLQSSSGGVFSILAYYVLQSNGVVFGARSNGLEKVWHDVATTMEELAPLRGSKYFQSEIGLSYRKVLGYLKQGKNVLFVGTPCQVAALRNYLGKDYSNLYVCDLVCHGVPSKMVFRRFVKEYEEKYQTTIVSYYRERQTWAPCVFSKELSQKPIGLDDIKETDSHNWKESKLYNVDEFNLMFHSNLIQRQSCQHCRFCHIPRVGDITLGDDWSYYNLHKDEPEKIKFGRSYILINNLHGQFLFEQVKESLVACVERKNVGGGHISIPPTSNPLSEYFFRELKHKDILDVLWDYTNNPTFKVQFLRYVFNLYHKFSQLYYQRIRRLKRFFCKS